MFDLGMNLKNLRKSKNWTQKRLSELLDVSEASISKYEGNLASPPIDTLRAYSALFKVSMDELLGMQSRDTVSLYGLTDAQAAVIYQLIDIFKSVGKNADISDKTYSVIGKTMTQLINAASEKQ